MADFQAKGEKKRKKQIFFSISSCFLSRHSYNSSSVAGNCLRHCLEQLSDPYEAGEFPKADSRFKRDASSETRSGSSVG